MARKRGSGEGSIFQRDGRWVGVVTVGQDQNGRPRPRWLYAKTRRELTEKMRELRTQVAGGIVADPGRERVADLVQRYLGTKRLELRPGTFELYESWLRIHVLSWLGGVPLRLLAPVHVLDWLRVLERKGSVPGSGSTASISCVGCSI